VLKHTRIIIEEVTQMKYRLSYVLAFVMLIFHAGWMLFTFLAMHINGGEVLLHEYSAVIRFI